MSHPYSNETQTRWNRGEFKRQPNQPGKTIPTQIQANPSLNRVSVDLPSVTLLIFLFATFVLSPSPASAGPQVGIAGGVFEPWDGSSGYEIAASVLAPLGKTERWRIGGELSFRDFETELFDANDISTQSIRISFVSHVKLIIDSPVQPYLGARLSLGLNIIDGDDVVRQRIAVTDVNDVGSGVGLAGIAGIEVPFGDHFAFFAEASAGADFQITQVKELPSGDEETEIENIGGLSGTAGVRFRF